MLADCNEEDGRRAALACTLIASARAAGVELVACFTEVLARLPGLPAGRAAQASPHAGATVRPP